MTTPPPLDQDLQSAETVQPWIKPVWLFAVLVIFTSVVWPILWLLWADSYMTNGPVFIIIPALQILATVGMVRSERKMAAHLRANDRLAPRLFWLYVAAAAAILMVTVIMWPLQIEGYKSVTYFVRYTAWLSKYWTSLFWAPATFIALVGTVVCAVIRAKALPKASTKPVGRRTTPPLDYTTDGQPIYPVVGYTADGQRVTADRAVGVHLSTAGTNSMAIVALVTGLTVAPLGIVFGHIALSQIKQSGQGGRGLAIAGLVLGYVSIALFAIAFLVIGARL